MDFFVESSGEWELGRETVTVGVVGDEVATAVAGAAVRRGRDMVALAGELGECSVRDERGRKDRRVAMVWYVSLGDATQRLNLRERELREDELGTCTTYKVVEWCEVNARSRIGLIHGCFTYKQIVTFV